MDIHHFLLAFTCICHHPITFFKLFTVLFFSVGKTKLFQMSYVILYCYTIPTVRALIWKVVFLKVYIVKSSMKKNDVFKNDQHRLDQSFAQRCTNTLRSHLSHAQQAFQRLENCYQTVGSTDQRAPPPSRSAIPRNTSLCGPAPALHL